MTAVLDIGKTNRALVLLDRQGEVVLERLHSCCPTENAFGYTALDTRGTQAWFRAEVQALDEQKASLERIIVATHGAAVALVKDGDLALPVPDYEWPGFEADASSPGLASFDETLSPLLPRGLNMGVQLDWLERHHPREVADADAFLPYAQYWAYWLSGIASSEVSSLGCHTLLWSHRAGTFSGVAQSRGWAARFAPIRRAWETLGTVRPELAGELGLPRNLQVHVGVHDSNACLAYYLRNWPRMTLVSSGTWVIVMAPGSSIERLDPDLDQLGNVSIRGESVPTGRFMGGRELGRLCAGADPALAKLAHVEGLLRRGLRILPGFEEQGGPFKKMKGEIWLDGRQLSLEQWQESVPPHERVSGAALYAAYTTAWLVKRLGGFGPIVVDGPFAHNETIMEVLAALMPHVEVYASDDAVDGTLRGSWSLTRWTEPGMLVPRIRPVQARADVAGQLLCDFAGWPRAFSAGGQAPATSD